ncbi:MJ1255/VC2487 family glycosyltransferase [Vibrio methylphosphonaticus]|uniref:MJ1255/VC2487 family glycosyltransferase n=1 Tax=Vibrio methylphosphonaticus TaxID=2946866 RepID=UPI00202A2A23|nr:MJ1255/VC2487 family glycosyltransferase [Vibrio methylphosphonaticus]MCL9775153.1 glycosyltransferase [Vibrio methylphosphonaticus]
MKILYGVQGTGNGHIARARAMSEALRTHDVEVDFLFSGRDKEKYFSMEQFGQYETRRGFSFVTKNGKVDYLQTATDNNILHFMQETRSLDVSHYDLVVNDFEPISAWAAKRQKVPTVSISHQNAFRFDVPQKGSNWLDSQIIQHFAPSDHQLGLHWYHFDQPILPPIVHTQSHEVTSDEMVLVYLPFESLDVIIDLLVRFVNQPFVCYHPDIVEMETIENLTMKPLSHQTFQIDLHRCNGVIANGGFELPSEALSLGKKLLVKPLEGQFEQQSNAATLESLGLAHSMDTLNASVVRDWLDEQQAERVVYPDVASEIAQWLMSGEWHCSQSLRQRLWEKVDFPSYVSM